MIFILRTSLYFVALTAIILLPNLLHGQQVTYTITGFSGLNVALDNTPSTDPLSAGQAPEVLNGESYVAEFLVDLSVGDSDPDPTMGLFTDAILFSSIEFSGGYVSATDFTGGDVRVNVDSGGGNIFIDQDSAIGPHSFLIFDVGNPFALDTLPTDLGSLVVGNPQVTFTFNEPTGQLQSLSTGDLVGFPAAVPEPSTACLLGFGVLACALRRRK